MTNFFETLSEYYSAVGEALKADAKRASVLPNPSDKGGIRELIYSKELINHMPSGCAVRFGGFLFNTSGAQSSQLDILVLSDSVPQFNVLGKSFSPIDGTAAVVEIKSNLQEKKLFEALDALSTLPTKLPDIGGNKKDYADWPFKIVYAHDGMKIGTALKKLKKYYEGNPKIPPENQPNIIHVCGEYVIYREPGNDKFQEITNLSDVFGLARSFLGIQNVAILQRSVLIDYFDYLSPLFDAVMAKNIEDTSRIEKKEEMTMAKSTEAALNRLENEEGTIKEKWADYRLIEEHGSDHEKWKLGQVVVLHPLPLPSGKIRRIISFLGLTPREPIDEISNGLIWKNSIWNFSNYPAASFIVLDSSIKFNKDGLPILQEVKVVQRPTHMRMNNSVHGEAVFSKSH